MKFVGFLKLTSNRVFRVPGKSENYYFYHRDVSENRTIRKRVSTICFLFLYQYRVSYTSLYWCVEERNLFFHKSLVILYSLDGCVRDMSGGEMREDRCLSFLCSSVLCGYTLQIGIALSPLLDLSVTFLKWYTIFPLCKIILVSLWNSN